LKPYLELVELQCMELMTQYGDIDILFFDGGEGPLQEKCKAVVWELQPDIVVTRGAIKTPEQTVPGIVLNRTLGIMHNYGNPMGMETYQ
jgi:alpha-L-fucosidase